MTVQLFSLEGVLQVLGLSETKAGLESVAAVGKETAASLNGIHTGAVNLGGSLGRAESAALNGAKGFRTIDYAAVSAADAQIKMGKAAADVEEKVEKGTRASGRHAEGIKGMLAPLRALAEAYLVFEGIHFVSEAIDQAAALHELSQKTGASVLMLSMLEFAGKRANVSSADLAMGFRGLSLSLGNLRDGQDKTVDAFGKLGLASKDFEGLSTDQAFKKIVEAMGHLPDGLEKSEVAARIFGRSGALLIPLLDDLAHKGFEATTKEAEKFHALISEKVSKDADDLKDKLGDLKFAFTGLAREAIPAITNLVKGLTELMGLRLRDWLDMFAAIATGDFMAIGRAMHAHDTPDSGLAGTPAEMSAARNMAKGRPFLPTSGTLGGGGGSKDANPLGTEISLLKEKFELNRAGAGDLTRLFVLEGQLTKALDGKNLSMKEELKLARDLKNAREAILAAAPPLLAPDALPGVPGRPVDLKGRLNLSGYLGGLVGAVPGDGGEVSKDDPAYMKGASFMQNLGKGLSDGLAKMRPLGSALTNMFQNIFNGAGVGHSIAQFGKSILAGMGSIFMQMAAKAILAAPLFQAIGAAMSNPFTAGFALLAFGIALTALGSAMGGAAHGDGSGGGGGGGIGRDQITQIHLTADGAGGFTAPQTHHGQPLKVLGKDSPEGQRLFAEFSGKAHRRGF